MFKSKSKLLIPFLSAYVVLMLITPFLIHKEDVASIVIEAPKASITKEKEDLQSRWDYEQLMLADPVTGEIPINYRQQEIKFANEMDNILKLMPSVAGASTNSTEDVSWLAVGPNNFGGRTRAFAIDIRNNDLLLAGGVSGGMWKSVDAGASWSKATTPDQIHSVSAIIQDTRPGNENTWYYGTGELVGNSARAPGAPFRGDGIFKSTDNGESWTQLPATVAPITAEFSSPLQYIWDIETDPTSTDDVVLAAIWGGIVRSDDGGNTWSTVLGQDLLGLPTGTDLNEIESVFFTDIHRTTDNTFYASLSSATNTERLSPEAGVYQSDDGINWTRIFSLAFSANSRTELASSPSNPDIVYFFTDDASEYKLRRYDRNTGQVVDRSDNLPGNSGDIDPVDSQNSYNMILQVHPDDPDIVFLGATNLYRSTDGFASQQNITLIGGYDPLETDGTLYPGHHPDQHELIFIPNEGNSAYSTNDGGVFLTTDILAEEVRYVPRNNAYATTQFYAGTFSQFPPDDFVFGGTQDNGTLLTENEILDNIPNGTRVLGGDGGYTASTRFGIYYYMSFQRSRVYRLSLNQNRELTSFARVDPAGGGSNPSQPYLFINPYVLDANNGNRMYLAGGDVIWRNRNMSQIPAGSNSPANVNWSRLDRSRIREGVITALQTSEAPRDILYFGTSFGQLYRIDRANAEDYEVQEITGEIFPENGYIRSIAIDPTNADRVLVSFSNYSVPSLFLTEDGGRTYTDVSGNLEENPDGSGNGPSVRWVTMVPKVDGSFEYYAGTSIGLFSTTRLNGASTIWDNGLLIKRSVMLLSI
jgi:hypothetical protein